jgi:hypothetical protein
MHESQQEDSEHTMVTLPFLNHEVPILSPADGKRYSPVCSVCQELCIRVFCAMWAVYSSTM